MRSNNQNNRSRRSRRRNARGSGGNSRLLQVNSRAVPTVHSPVVQPAPIGRPPPRSLRNEPKYNDTSFVATSVPGTAVLTSLTATTNGTTDLTRIGDRINLFSIEFRWTVLVADSSNVVRVVLLQWLSDDGIDAPSLAKVLANAATPVNSPFNHDNKAKFIVLYDHRVLLSTYEPNRGDTVELLLPASRVQPEVMYQAGASTGQNNLYALMVSDSGPSPHPVLEGVARVNWYDC